VSLTPLNPLPLSHLDYGKLYKNVHVRSRGVIDTAEPELFKRLTRLSRRIRSHMRTALVRESGPLMGLFDEQTESRNSRDTVPLKTLTDFSP
jgi:hypothetical protein